MLSPKKDHLFQIKVIYLGHIVNKNNVAVDPDKVQAIQQWLQSIYSLEEYSEIFHILPPLLINVCQCRQASEKTFSKNACVRSSTFKLLIYFGHECQQRTFSTCRIDTIEFFRVVKSIAHLYKYLYERKFLLGSYYAILKWIFWFKHSEWTLCSMPKAVARICTRDIEHRPETSRRNTCVL